MKYSDWAKNIDIYNIKEKRDRGKGRETEKERKKERKRDREKERQREKERETEGERKRDRERKKERQREKENPQSVRNVYSKTFFVFIIIYWQCCVAVYHLLTILCSSLSFTDNTV